MTALRRHLIIFSMPIVMSATVAIPAAPSAASQLCNIGFVYGIAIDGSRVCVPLTKDILDAIGKNQPTSSGSSSASATAVPTPVSSSSAPTSHTPPQATEPAYVNSDTGTAVRQAATGGYVDAAHGSPVPKSLVVPVTALIPDASTVAAAKVQAASSPSPAPIEPTASTLPPSPSPSHSDAPLANDPVQARVTDPNVPQIVSGSLLSIAGLVVIYFGVLRLRKADPRHGRRRASRA